MGGKKKDNLCTFANKKETRRQVSHHIPWSYGILKNKINNKSSFIQTAILRDFSSFSFSCDITLSTVCASAPSCVVSRKRKRNRKLKKKTHIGKRPLSSIIDRCLFWLTGRVSLYVRNIAGPQRRRGSRWKQVCHKRRRVTHTPCLSGWLIARGNRSRCGVLTISPGLRLQPDRRPRGSDSRCSPAPVFFS